MPDENFRVIYHCESMGEAEIVKSLLESQGIEARIPGELSTGPHVTSQETQGNVKIEVPHDRAHEARTVIQNAMDEGEELDGWLAAHPDEDPS